jgi:hypothetical protein
MFLFSHAFYIKFVEILVTKLPPNIMHCPLLSHEFFLRTQDKENRVVIERTFTVSLEVMDNARKNRSLKFSNSVYAFYIKVDLSQLMGNGAGIAGA